MIAINDQDLLQAYALNGSESAFAELTRRYVDLVYSTAKRLVRDDATARDVTQAVFVALAQSATKLRHRAILAGWLHVTARNLAANTIRTEVRRRTREQRAVVMHESTPAEPNELWESIAPWLDTAIAGLNRNDREAILLRYFQNKSAREIAHLIDTSEEAAQKRVSRAVERLRRALAGQGVSVGASGLTVAISASAVQTAPAGLATASECAALLVPTVLPNIMSSILQKIVATAALIVLIATIWHILGLQGKIRGMEREQVRLKLLLDQANQERDEVLQKAADLIAANRATEQGQRELARLRAELARLHDQKSKTTSSPVLPTVSDPKESTNIQVRMDITSISASARTLQKLGFSWPAQTGNQNQFSAEQWLAISNSLKSVPGIRHIYQMSYKNGSHVRMQAEADLVPDEFPTTAENAVTHAVMAALKLEITTSVRPDDGSCNLSLVIEAGRTNILQSLARAPLSMTSQMSVPRGGTAIFEREMPAEVWPEDFTDQPPPARTLLVFLTPTPIDAKGNSLFP